MQALEIECKSSLIFSRGIEADNLYILGKIHIN